MKRTLQLFVLTTSIGAVPAVDAQDQNAAVAQPADTTVAPVVYETPVVYTGQVIYQAPVVYNAPVVYATTPAVAVDTGHSERDCQPVSTVVYIGGGSVRYQESGNNCGSTVTVIGGRH